LCSYQYGGDATNDNVGMEMIAERIYCILVVWVGDAGNLKVDTAL
jgi:hypothetical protein